MTVMALLTGLSISTSKTENCLATGQQRPLIAKCYPLGTVTICLTCKERALVSCVPDTPITTSRQPFR